MNKNSNYYIKDPFGGIETGDIFLNLPSMGLLKEEFVAGIVITPACDLSNVKSETITYLPIISVKSWLAYDKTYLILKQDLENCCKTLKLEAINLIDNKKIDLSTIEIIEEECNTISTKNKKDAEQKKKLIAILNILKDVNDHQSFKIRPGELKEVWNGNWEKMIQKIITNSVASDIHFLPQEDKNKENCFIIKEHSIVLFRYPITVPFEILNEARSMELTSKDLWDSKIKSLTDGPCVKTFTQIPLRGLRLRQDYLSDLLTRYISLYIRIGSPDFDFYNIDQMLQEIKNEIL